MNARCAPQRVGRRHLADQRTDLAIDWCPTAARPGRTSRPAAAKPVMMPSHHCLRLDDHQRGAPAPPCCGQPDPEQPVVRPEARTLCRAFYRPELLAQRDVLEDHFVMAAAG